MFLYEIDDLEIRRLVNPSGFYSNCLKRAITVIVSTRRAPTKRDDKSVNSTTPSPRILR